MSGEGSTGLGGVVVVVLTTGTNCKKKRYTKHGLAARLEPPSPFVAFHTSTLYVFPTTPHTRPATILRPLKSHSGLRVAGDGVSAPHFTSIYLPRAVSSVETRVSRGRCFCAHFHRVI